MMENIESDSGAGGTGGCLSSSVVRMWNYLYSIHMRCGHSQSISNKTRGLGAIQMLQRY